MSTIKLKRSSVPGKVPSVSDLELGEVAINTADGKIYIKKNDGGVEYIVPFTENTAAEIIAKLLTVDGAGSELDADLLDGQQGSYYLDWTNVTNKPDPNISVTLSGDVSGSADTTLTDLANGSISITTVVADDSHNHIIANVDGLQTALDNKLPLTGKAADSDLLDGQDSTYYLDWTNVTNKPDPVVTVSLSGDVSGTGSATLTNLANGSISITATIADDSHNHIIANVDGLQSALDSKLNLAGGSVTGDVILNNSADLVFRDKNGTFPTSAGSFFWDLNDDEARIYATQPDSDQIDFVFKISDNAGPTDRFVFWIDDFRGSTFDKYPAHFDGQAQYLSVPVDVNGDKDLANARLRVPFSGDVQIDGYRVWHMGNDGSGSGLDADTLDGQQGSYYLDWTNTTNKPDPTITLAGDLTGSVTLTDLGNGTLTASVVDDSHNHVISNVDGLQTALDGKLSITGKAVDSDLLDGLDSTQFLRSDVNATHQTATSRIALSTDSGGSISLGRIDGVASAPYIDFNSGATAVDYDSRITSTTGTGVTGQGDLTVFSGTFFHNSDQVFTDGYHPNADKLTTARTISLTGDVSGSVSFDGSSNVSITATVADDSHNHVISNVDGLQTALDSKVDLAGDTMTGFLTLHADPTQGLHAATKNYVDEVATGLQVKGSVEAATTTNLSGTYDNGTSGVGATITLPAAATLSIDGWTSWSLYDGILVKDQTDPAENGRYYVSTVGDASTNWVLTRCNVCDEPAEIIGAFVFVSHGNTYESTGWAATVQDVDTFAVGVDAITWTQFSGAGTYLAGTDLTLDGTTFNLNPTIAANTTGNAATATALQTARTISLTGDVSGSVSFDGTSNVSITATVADDSHNHIIANVDGLQTALDGKLPTTGKAVDSDLLDGQDSTYYLDWTNTTNKPDPTIAVTLTGDVSGSANTTLTDLANGSISITTVVADDSHNHIIANVDGLQTALDGKLSTTGKAADAELLDGLDSTQFIRSDVADTVTANITFTDSKVRFDDTSFGSFDWELFQDPNGKLTFTVVGTLGAEMELTSDGANYQNAELTVGGYKVWTAGNDGAGSNLDADLLDGQQGSYYLDWTNVTNKPDPTVSVTLTGDVSGSGNATLTDLANGAISITATVADDSHNHVISNVDGLQAALDAKLDTSSYTAADVLTKIKTVDGATSGLDADLLDGQQGSYYLDWTNTTNKPDPNITVTLSGDVSGSGNATLTDLANGTITITTAVADDSHNHVISNVDGLQAALDAKLDTSSYTAADVLTKIKTVDSAASGLDADLLDGQHGSYYLDYTNFTNTPTIPQSGVDFDPAGTDNSTDVTLTGAYDYLTITGQQITLNQVDAATDISGLATVATSGSYNDLSNLPTLYTTANANTDIDARVTKSFVDALNVDANTLNGQLGSYYLDWTNVTNKPDPTITVTLTGDVTGSGNTTLTDLANGSINITTSGGVSVDDAIAYAIALG